MEIYLVRHADALPVDEQSETSDEDRPLSERGVRQAQMVAQALKRLKVAPGQILSSPLRRAMQTAEELGRVLHKPRLQPEPCDFLAPGQSSKKLARCLFKVDAESLVLVGHEPDLSKHTAWLIGSKETQLEFPKGGVACVRCDVTPQKGAGTLLWLITPKLLKAVGGVE